MDRAAQVSAVITTHKRGPEILGRAIESVLRQTVPASEVTVVDDAPDWEKHGEILALMKQYEGRVRYIENRDHPGANGSRNIGINATKSPIIGLLDDDDEWTEDKLEAMLPAFTDGVGLVYGRIDYVKDGTSLHFDHKREYYQGRVYDEVIQYGNFIGGCSVPLFTREACVKAGMFDEAQLSGQDYDLWIRIAKYDAIAFVDKPVIRYYYTNDAITATSYRRIEGRKQLLDKYQDEYKRFPGVLKRRVGNVILYLIVDGQLKEAAKMRTRYAEHVDIPYFIKLLLKGTAKRITIKTGIQNR